MLKVKGERRIDAADSIPARKEFFLTTRMLLAACPVQKGTSVETTVKGKTPGVLKKTFV